ncbi:hypothetical protein [Streptomyces sp. NPDC102264]|uniref:hypothetical protein n=1 Tax=Streptomyces sp. NPDC102264 TaxID=3366149 RepID=UPI0038198F0A
MTDQQPMNSATRMLRRLIEHDRERFADDARNMAELAARVAEAPSASRVPGDLSRLSQGVADLIRRDAWIRARVEAVGLVDVATLHAADTAKEQ